VTVVGSRHASVQRLRRLSGRRSARLEEGAFVIDGPMLLREALRAGVSVEVVLATPDAEDAVLAEARAAGAEVHEVAQDVLARAVDTVTPNGLAAIAARVEVGIDDALTAAVAGPLTLVLVDVADPGNAGTLLRAAEAAGAAAVLFCGSSVDPSNPKCVRASAGALFHVPVALGGDVQAVLGDLGRRGVRRAASVVEGGTPYDAVDLTGPVALVLGSEAHGLSPEVLALVDHPVSIPMAGRSESLNVAMAGAVLCFEALRQRRAGGSAEPIGEPPA
jgi:TrmH family RNA methyltransferase